MALNSQTSAVTTGGGTGAASAANTSADTVGSNGSATASSGPAVSMSAPLQAGASPAADEGATSARSGEASANGVTSTNRVSNQSLASVRVVGSNRAPVSVQASNQVLVESTGAARAASGGAVAQDAPTLATGALGDTSTAAGALSEPSTATGGEISTTVDGSITTRATVTPGPVPTPLGIVHRQSVSASTTGLAVASSDPAASGTPVPGVSPQAAASGNGVGATTGAARAAGLVAQNSVNTRSNVNVRVGGDNFGVVTVIVQAITRIFNQGQADATSGNAGAEGEGAAMAGAQKTNGVSTGRAAATGAHVNNAVNLHSSTALTIRGDNRNPIDVFVNMVVNLTNWGRAQATSGNALSAGSSGSGPQGATANTGSATATGLVVDNSVDLGADVWLDITGNNYAPISVRILYDTTIWNRGVASATSGSAQALGGTPQGGAQALGGAAQGGAPTGVGTSRPYWLPPAPTITASPTATSTVDLRTSTQVTAPAGSTTAQMTSRVDTGAASTSGSDGGTETAGGPAALRAAAISGGASCVGASNSSRLVDVQSSFVGSPDASRSALNSVNHRIDTDGGSRCGSGFAGVNATPTPTPEPVANGPQHPVVRQEEVREEARTRFRQTQNVASGGFRGPTGALVQVDFSLLWPDRDGLPMPRPLIRERASVPPGAAGNPLASTDESSSLGVPPADEKDAGRATTEAPGLPRPEDGMLRGVPGGFLGIDLGTRWWEGELPATPSLAMLQQPGTAGGPRPEPPYLPIAAGLAGVLMLANGARTRRGQIVLAMLAARGLAVVRLSVALIRLSLLLLRSL